MTNQNDEQAEESLRLSNLAYGFAAMTDGPAREAFHRQGLRHLSEALDHKFGPVDPETAAMTDDELLQSLGLI